MFLINFRAEAKVKKEEELTLQEYIKPFLKEIDFLSMTTESILNTVHSKGIFSHHEILAIIQAKHRITEDISDDCNFPSYLRTTPKVRRFVLKGGNIKFVKLIKFPACYQYDGKMRDNNDRLLFTFQSSRSFKLSKISGSSSCFKGSCMIEITDDSHKNLLPNLPYSTNASWYLTAPFDVIAGTTYFVTIRGKNRSKEHPFQMYSASTEGVEIVGESMMCDIEMEFKI